MADTLPTAELFTDHFGHDLAAGFAILVGAMIAAGGGLGGGGVFVPIYILILGYPPKFAAALSQATIFGGSIVNLIMNLRKTHPTRTHRPLTDFSTLLIFEPMLLVGTIIGVLLNVICPDILILILLAIVLSYATRRTLKKGIRLWKKETFEMRKAEQTQENDTKTGNVEMQTVETKRTVQTQTDANTQNNTDNNTDTNNNGDSNNGDSNNDDAVITKMRCLSMSDISDAGNKSNKHNKEELDKLSQSLGIEASMIKLENVPLCKQMIEMESQTIKPMNIIAMVWIIVSLFNLAKKENITGIESLNVIRCSITYWIITFLPFPFMIGVSYYMTKKEYNRYQIKLNSGCWVPAFGDIELNGSFIKILKYPLIASIAGILGGLLGIGGGMIVSPLLIELGVIPTVAAATSAMAVLITSSSAMLQFILLGYLQYDYTFFFMAIGIIGTFIGQTAVNFAVKTYGRVSVVIFAVAIIMALAIILMLTNGIISTLHGVSWAFSTPC